MLPYKKHLKVCARQLRSSMTDAEVFLWSKLRRKQLYGLQFYRQKPLGNFVVDFYCPSAQLVIEVDGGQHYTKEGMAQDAIRDAYLNAMGLTVLRFSNLDVLRNIDGVFAEIIRCIEGAIGEGGTKSPWPPF